jgi:hypothetical protein
MSDGMSAGPVIYIDRSIVHDGRWDELKAGIHALVAFVDSHQPQMAAYGFYLNEGANEMTVVAVHPDAASLERHIQVGGPEFNNLGPFLELREIEIYGRLSKGAVELVQQKAASLGDAGAVTVREEFAGFDRINPGHL